MYTKEIFASIAELDRPAWESAVPPDTISMQFDYLRVIEELHRDEVQCHYAIIRKEGEVVGAAYFQTINFKAIYLKNFLKIDEAPNFLWKALLTLIGWFLRFWSWNLVLSGNIYFTGERGMHFAPSVSESDAAKLLRECFVWVRKHSRRSVDGYMLNNIYDADATGIHHFLETERWAAFPVDPDMHLTIRPEWRSFEDYSGALQSKYRVRMKKVLEVSSVMEYRELNAEQVAAHNDELFALYMETAHKAAFNLGYLAEDYFAVMKSTFRDNFKVMAYFLDGKMVGFMSALRSGRDLDVNYMGLDYSVNQDLKLYNRMLYDLVALGIRNGAACMHLGRTATEIKSTIGAVPRKMHIYLSSQTYYKRRGMHYFKPYFGSPQYVIRHPFKANKPS